MFLFRFFVFPKMRKEDYYFVFYLIMKYLLNILFVGGNNLFGIDKISKV